MHDDLLNLFNQIAKLDKSEIEFIKRSFKFHYLSKGEFFLKSGEISEYIGFLQRGLIRYFVYKDEEESTFEFTKEKEFVGDYQSFNKRTISVQNIQAIEDCEMLVINYSDLQKLFNVIKNGNLIGRLIVEHRFEIMVNQLLAVYMQNHEERYKRFINQYSGLFQRIPQYLIASYVGVKPQSLSRIRKRIAKSIS